MRSAARMSSAAARQVRRVDATEPRRVPQRATREILAVAVGALGDGMCEVATALGRGLAERAQGQRTDRERRHLVRPVRPIDRCDNAEEGDAQQRESEQIFPPE